MLSTLYFLSLLLVVSATFKCKNQNNQNVDWFTIYKLPMDDSSDIAGSGEGYAFSYMDAKTKSFTVSKVPLNKQNQAVAYTLKQYYQSQNDSKVFHVMYNDDPPEEANLPKKYFKMADFIRSTKKILYGHTKGVAFFDKQGGVWLVHSVPNFPPSKAYHYPESATRFGQSLLCITMKYSELSKLGTVLYYNHPKIYSSSLPVNMAAENPDLQKVISKKYQKGSPSYYITELVSAGRNSFKTFAKTAQFNKDLYDGLVAPQLRIPLYVETWRRGSEVELECKAKLQVLDVQDVKVGEIKEFKYTRDHSKFAVSSDSKHPFVCIGDINRMQSQYVRGGGTVCMQDSHVWRTYRDVIMYAHQLNLLALFLCLLIAVVCIPTPRSPTVEGVRPGAGEPEISLLRHIFLHGTEPLASNFTPQTVRTRSTRSDHSSDSNSSSSSKEDSSESSQEDNDQKAH